MLSIELLWQNVGTGFSLYSPPKHLRFYVNNRVETYSLFHCVSCKSLGILGSFHYNYTETFLGTKMSLTEAELTVEGAFKYQDRTICTISKLKGAAYPPILWEFENLGIE